MSIWRHGKAHTKHRDAGAVVERWWTENQEKYWNPETGMYVVGAVERDVASILNENLQIEPTDDQLKEIEERFEKTLDKSSETGQAYHVENVVPGSDTSPMNETEPNLSLLSTP